MPWGWQHSTPGTLRGTNEVSIRRDLPIERTQDQQCHTSLLRARGFFGPCTYCFLVFFLAGGTVPSPLVLISVKASLALKGY